MFKGFKNLQSTTTNFLYALFFISIASVCIIAFNAIRMSNDWLDQFGEMAIANTHQAVFDSIIMYDKDSWFCIKPVRAIGKAY